MIKTLLHITLALSLISSNIVTAATLIQSKSAQNQITNIYISNNKARIEMPQKEGFIVMDVAKKTMQAVIHKERMIMDMSDLMKEGNTSTQGVYVDTYTKSMGLGPKIIGYETEEYALYANDNYCGSMYVSVEAMRDIGLKKFARAFLDMEKNMQTQISELTGGMNIITSDPCSEARSKTNMNLRDLGFPLKTTNKNKQFISIITKVNKNTRLPANAFVIPADYKVTNTAEMMGEAKKQMQQMQPQLQEMMKNMTPEMRRMMQREMQQYRQ